MIRLISVPGIMAYFKILILLLVVSFVPCVGRAAEFEAFFKQFCVECHDATTPESGFDLTALKLDFEDSEVARRWVRIYDRILSEEMPPRDARQPGQNERAAFLKSLREAIIAGEEAVSGEVPTLRRLTRAEYEHTIRDLFKMPGIALAGNLPADGSAHGFDKHPEALDVSHVNIAKYLESADHILDDAIATRPEPPTIQTRRISLVNRGGFVAHVVMNGDGILLKNKQPDPDFPPAADQNHLDQGAHERFGSFDNGATVGLFRHEDESFNPYLIEHVTIYPARYRVRTSLWSFQWDKGAMLPGRDTEAGRLSVVQLTGDGRGGQHPSYVLGYFDAPETSAREHEVVVWLNQNELIGFNTASLAPAANYARKGRAMAFTGPGIAVDWVDVEGPLYESWPPASHQLLFDDLPLAEFKADEHPGVRPPQRPRFRQLGAGQNRPDPEPGLWTVHSASALEDADRLLAAFLPKLFRRSVADDVRQQYVAIVKARLDAGDCFELAMRAAYRDALVAPDFLYHLEPAAKLDDNALACRLSYFLWNSQPDESLRGRAAAGTLSDPGVLHVEVERLLNDPRSERFIEDFLGQWLKLRQIAATDPDRKLYPEFSPYLQDSMLAESRAYFRELLSRNLDASHLVKSDFVMINEKLAKHYGIDGVSGSATRRVALPENCPRGGILTQAAVLKVTANGTTTSPVPRGAFVMERLLGQPPELPPSNVAAIEPDVRGTTTIRAQLAKHREDPVCASCHRRIDPPGFALEAFDVIGGFRSRYRSIGDGDPAERGVIDPFIGISFKLGPDVDASGELPDGHTFNDIRQYQLLAAANPEPLLRNLAEQLVVYSTGRAASFGDRPAIQKIVQRTLAAGGGLRTLLHEVAASPLFNGQPQTLAPPADFQMHDEFVVGPEAAHRTMMTPSLPDIPKPVLRSVPAAELPAIPKFEFDAEHSVTVQVTGLFMPERTDAFRAVQAEFPEIQIASVDYETASATIRFAAESDLFRNAKPEQIIERLHNRVRQLTGHTIGIKEVPTVPREQLQRLEIPIVGLDCQACSLAAYEIIARVEGVEQATASFRDGRVVVWIDPSRTAREKLAAVLTQRGVTLKTE